MMKYRPRNLMWIALLLVTVVFIAGCSSTPPSEDAGSSTISQVTIFKEAGCNCCEGYRVYLEDNKYAVDMIEVQDTDATKEKFGVPANLRSCHTSVIGNYFIEGHVPLEVVNKLLSEKPDIKGIALPGMPAGSPGMSGVKSGEFVIYAIAKDGSTSEYMRI